jgi:hypothetical protein
MWSLRVAQTPKGIDLFNRECASYVGVLSAALMWYLRNEMSLLIGQR